MHNNENGFELAQGVVVGDTSKVDTAYTVNGDDILCSIGISKLQPLLKQIAKALPEPLFFFIELPKRDETNLEGGYDVYYLDNCTGPVIDAILKRYGDLLCHDGLVRFGVASHETEEEAYVLDYKVLSIYSPRIKRFTKILDQNGINVKNDIITVADVISDDNIGSLANVELNGENIYGIQENLEELGMYFSHSTDE